MKRELLLTSDGSHTMLVTEMKITYHSTHGAVQESRHIFIKAGFTYVLPGLAVNNISPLRIFEMGFGTGLNALLSFAETKEKKVCVSHQSAELYPLSLQEAGTLNYVTVLADESLSQPFLQMHQCASNEEVTITPFFTLHKSEASLPDIIPTQPFHLIYFDAFAPDVQPELWTQTVFEQMYDMLYNNGILVTYCSKGTVRRAMQAAGFCVEKLQGPPGKREMVCAIKKE